MIENILDKIGKHFAKPAAKKRIQVIAKNDRNIEGWFKAELMLLLNEQWEELGLTGWYPEVGHHEEPHSKKCDFVLRFKKKRRLLGIEVKTAFVGDQGKRTLDKIRGTLNPEFDSTWIGLTSYTGEIAKDAEKLTRMGVDYRMCLIFVYGESGTVWRFNQQHNEKECKKRVRKSLKKTGTWNEFRDEEIFDDDDGIVLRVIAYVKKFPDET